MYRAVIIVFALAVAFATTPGMASDAGSFKAMSKIAGAKAMSNHELSQIAGADLVFGHTVAPIFTPSISNFLNEVLLTQLGVGGRSPVLVTTRVQTILTALPGGGVNIALEPHTFILAKDLTCVGCFAP